MSFDDSWMDDVLNGLNDDGMTKDIVLTVKSTGVSYPDIVATVTDGAQDRTDETAKAKDTYVKNFSFMLPDGVSNLAVFADTIQCDGETWTIITVAQGFGRFRQAQGSKGTNRKVGKTAGF